MIEMYSDVSKTMGSRYRRNQGRVKETESSCKTVLDDCPASTRDIYMLPVFWERALARHRRMKGAYVSRLVSIVAIQITPPSMAIKPRFQRQPWVSLRKPPATGPEIELTRISKCARAKMATRARAA